MDFSIAVYDEGLTLYGALRVFHGQVPYRDFWTMYPPGQFYLLAAAFHISVLAIWERIFYVVFNAVSAVVILHLLENLTGRRWLSRFATATILTWLSSCSSYGFPVYPALTFILLGTFFMQERWRGGSVKWPILAGASIGVAALFRHDLALYALVALSLTSVVSQMRGPKSQRNFAGGADALPLIIAAGVIVLPVIGWLLIQVPAHDLYYGMIYVPGFVYPRVRALPFPGFALVVSGFLHPWRIVPSWKSVDVGDGARNIVWFPQLIIVVTVFWLVPRLRRRDLESWKATTCLGLLLLTALLFLKGFVRVSALHMAQAVVPAFMILAILVSHLRSMSGALRAGVTVTAIWAFLSLLAPVRIDYDTFRQNLRRVNHHGPEETFAQACHPAPGLERARCVFLNPTQKDAIQFIQARTRPDEVIFVGVPHYDILFDNDIAFYFFSKREAATRWYDLHPGVETTAPIQQQMISELQKSKVRYIVQTDWNFPIEPNAGRFSSGVTLLDDYIRQNYVLQQKFGLIEILQRSDSLTAGTTTPVTSASGSPALR